MLFCIIQVLQGNRYVSLGKCTFPLKWRMAEWGGVIYLHSAFCFYSSACHSSMDRLICIRAFAISPLSLAHSSPSVRNCIELLCPVWRLLACLLLASSTRPHSRQAPVFAWKWTRVAPDNQREAYRIGFIQMVVTCCCWPLTKSNFSVLDRLFFLACLLVSESGQSQSLTISQFPRHCILYWTLLGQPWSCHCLWIFQCLVLYRGSSGRHLHVWCHLGCIFKMPSYQAFHSLQPVGCSLFVQCSLPS